jgi:hypothetical protein
MNRAVILGLGFSTLMAAGLGLALTFDSPAPALSPPAAKVALLDPAWFPPGWSEGVSKGIMDCVRREGRDAARSCVDRAFDTGPTYCGKPPHVMTLKECSERITAQHERLLKQTRQASR